MSSDTVTTITITDNDGRELTAEELAVMDRAVREAREKGFCYEFDRLASVAFNVDPSKIFDSEGYNCGGYDQEGYNRDGFDRLERDREGYDRGGYDREGYDRDGYNFHGLNRDGFDKDGNDGYRFDANGWDRDGFDRTYGERRPANRAWYAKQAAKPDSEFCYNYQGRKRPSNT